AVRHGQVAAGDAQHLWAADVDAEIAKRRQSISARRVRRRAVERARAAAQTQTYRHPGNAVAKLVQRENSHSRRNHVARNGVTWRLSIDELGSCRRTHREGA